MAKVTKNISGADQWTDWISPWILHESSRKQGNLAYSISGSFSATVTIQRSFDDGATALNVETFTVPNEGLIDDPTYGVKYRIGVATGDYTSGTVTVGLYT